MKRSKRIFVLLAILIVACGATFAATKITEHKENIQNSEDTILGIPYEDVIALSWSYDEVSLSFAKNDEGVWHWEDDEAFPVSENMLVSLLDLFTDFSVSFSIESVDDYSQYGLDEPICTIEVTTLENSYTLTLGDFSKLDSQRYVSIGDGNAYLVSTDPMDSFELTIEDMIENDVALEYSAISTIKISGKENLEIQYTEDEGLSICASDKYYIDDLPLKTYNVTSYLSLLTGLSLTDYVSYNASDEELETYGLNDPELGVTVTYTDEEDIEGNYTLYVSRSAEERSKEESEEDSEDDSSYVAYARVGQSQIIYEISSDTFEELMSSTYNDFRHEEAFTADFTTVTSIEITLEDKSYILSVLEKEDEDDTTVTWVYGEEEISVDNIQYRLEALTADEFTDEVPSGQEEIALTIHLDNEAFPSISLVLYRYDGTNCLATVDGKSFALVSRTQVVNLIESINAIVLN